MNSALIIDMNSNMAVLFLVVISGAVLWQKSNAFVAGIGNMKRRDFRDVSYFKLFSGV